MITISFYNTSSRYRCQDKINVSGKNVDILYFFCQVQKNLMIYDIALKPGIQGVFAIPIVTVNGQLFLEEGKGQVLYASGMQIHR